MDNHIFTGSPLHKSDSSVSMINSFAFDLDQNDSDETE